MVKHLAKSHPSEMSHMRDKPTLDTQGQEAAFRLRWRLTTGAAAKRSEVRLCCWGPIREGGKVGAKALRRKILSAGGGRPFY